MGSQYFEHASVFHGLTKIKRPQIHFCQTNHRARLAVALCNPSTQKVMSITGYRRGHKCT